MWPKTRSLLYVLSSAAILLPQAAFAEAHLQAAISHTRKAVTYISSGRVDLFTLEAKIAAKEMEASNEVDPNPSKAEAFKLLREAYQHAQVGHLVVAGVFTKAALTALTAQTEH